MLTDKRNDAQVSLKNKERGLIHIDRKSVFRESFLEEMVSLELFKKDGIVLSKGNSIRSGFEVRKR